MVKRVFAIISKNLWWLTSPLVIILLWTLSDDFVANFFYMIDTYPDNIWISVFAITVFVVNFRLLSDLFDQVDVICRNRHRYRISCTTWRVNLWLIQDITASASIFLLFGLVIILGLLAQFLVFFRAVTGIFFYDGSIPYVLSFFVLFLLFAVAFSLFARKINTAIFIEFIILFCFVFLFPRYAGTTPIHKCGTAPFGVGLLKCRDTISGRVFPYSDGQLKLKAVIGDILKYELYKSFSEDIYAPKVYLYSDLFDDYLDSLRAGVEDRELANCRLTIGTTSGGGEFRFRVNISDLVSNLNKKLNNLQHAYFYRSRTQLDPHCTHEYLILPFLSGYPNPPIYSIGKIDLKNPTIGVLKPFTTCLFEWIYSLLLFMEDDKQAEINIKSSFETLDRIETRYSGNFSANIKTLKSLIFANYCVYNIKQRINDTPKDFMSFEISLQEAVSNGDIAAFVNGLKYHYITATLNSPINPSFKNMIEMYEAHIDSIEINMRQENIHYDKRDIRILQNEIKTIYLCAQIEGRLIESVSAISEFEVILDSLLSIPRDYIVQENIYILKNNIEFVKLSEATSPEEYQKQEGRFREISNKGAAPPTIRAKAFYGLGITLLEQGQYDTGIAAFDSSYSLTKHLFTRYQVDQMLTKIRNIKLRDLEDLTSISKNIVRKLLDTHHRNFPLPDSTANRHDDLYYVINT